MHRKDKAILPLATALAAFSASAAPVAASVPADTPSPAPEGQVTSGGAAISNTVYSTGDHLFGLLVTKKADGTAVAQHGSHVSHGSHGSHTSHTSSRF